MSISVTEKDFKSFVKVQDSGKYNMFMEMDTARAETDLSKEQWVKIMKHYQTFYDAWINKEFNSDES
tara:strand:+ start:484 stop:684 length:201 start_codon:yes stop_codon:yes gene_type:complete